MDVLYSLHLLCKSAAVCFLYPVNILCSIHTLYSALIIDNKAFFTETYSSKQYELCSQLSKAYANNNLACSPD